MPHRYYAGARERPEIRKIESDPIFPPPIGVNVYVMAKVAPDVPLMEIFRGILPFFAAALLVVALISVFPEIVTWLPELALKMR